MSLNQQQCVLRAKIIGPRNHASENMNGVVSNFREVFVVFEYVWDLIFPREFDLLRKRIWVFHFWDLICSSQRIDLSQSWSFHHRNFHFLRVDFSESWSFTELIFPFLTGVFFNHFWGLIFSWLQLSFSEGWSFHFWVSHFLGFGLSEIWEYISISDSHIFCDLIFIVVYLAISEHTFFSENWYFSDLIFPLLKLTFFGISEIWYFHFWMFEFLRVDLSESSSFTELIFPFLSGIFVLRIDLSESWFFPTLNLSFLRLDGFIFGMSNFPERRCLWELIGSFSEDSIFLRIDRSDSWYFHLCQFSIDRNWLVQYMAWSHIV